MDQPTDQAFLFDRVVKFRWGAFGQRSIPHRYPVTRYGEQRLLPSQGTESAERQREFGTDVASSRRALLGAGLLGELDFLVGER